MLEWKVTHPRIFRHHKLALMEKGTQNLVGREGGESGKSWDRESEYYRHSSYEVSKEIIFIRDN